MGEARLVLMILMVLGVLARNSLIAAAAGILLVLDHLRLQALYRYLEQRGLELGLIFMLIAVLVPLAAGKVTHTEIKSALTSLSGLAAIAGGMTAAFISGQGVLLMQRRPEIIVGLVVGSVLGVLFLRGTPVGPLAAAGLAAVLLRLLGQG